MAQRTGSNDNYIKQGSILAGASLLVRIIGMLYRFPMSNIMGEDGNGLYSFAFEIYDIMLIISSYSLPLAISKIISAKRVKREHRNILKIFRCAMILACISGATAALIMFFGAPFFEKVMGGGTYTGLKLPLRVLAPTVFIVAVMGVLRGLFQGKGNMLPTAVSQIIEQIVNAVVSIYAAYSLMQAHKMAADAAGYGAAGGTMGTLFGALSGCLFLGYLYYLYRPRLKRLAKRDRLRENDSAAGIYRIILLTAIPIILSQTVYQISGIIDFNLFGFIQSNKGFDDMAVKTATGLYSTKYRLLLSVPISIATSMSSSILPSIVASFAVRDYAQISVKIKNGMKFNMMIAFPCFVGLTVFGTQMLMMLFPNQDYVTGGKLLLAGSIAVVLYAISNITGAVLQGIDKMRLPVIHSAIALVIHVIVVFILLNVTDMGVFALVAGNVVFPLIVALLNMNSIYRNTTYRQEIKRTFLVPLAAAAVMGAVSYLVYKGLYYIFPHNTIVLIFAIMVAVVVYFVLYLLFKGADNEEIYEFPMGVRIVRLGRKLHIIKD